MDAIQKARNYLPNAIKIRRELHQHPELAFAEINTASFIANKLIDYSFKVQTGIGKTGVVGLHETKKPGPVILLRFDMDALPIQEETAHPFRSTTPGIMHACGHDGHVAIGLTLAELISKDPQFSGIYKFVFQPAEEIGQGARAMIADGVLLNPRPDFALAVHLWAEKPTGWIGIREGPVMAASSTFLIKVKGVGGHGARPQASKDPIVASAQIILALQSILSRNVAPLDSAVLSVTAIKAGSAANVIPEIVEMKGTLRYFTKETEAILTKRMQEIVHLTAEAMGCTGEVEIHRETTPVVNDKRVADIVKHNIGSILPDAMIDGDYHTLISEDFSFFLDEIPGALIFVGAGIEKDGKNYPHHHPKFDIDESALWMAAALLAQACLELSGC